MGTQARNRSREQRTAKLAAQRRIARRNRLLARIGGVVVVGLLVAIVIVVINAANKKEPAAKPDDNRPVVAPATATAAGAVVVGKAEAPVRVDLYVDFMCPYCGKFERANATELERLVADGTIQIHLYPLAFLDKMSDGTRYSTRAANAFATVADRAPDKLLAFNRALFAKQPAEGGPGLTNDEIATLAGEAGVPADVVSHFTEGTYEPWLAASTAEVFRTGVTGTPTVKINGTVFKGDLYTAGPLTQAITAARGR